jgi:YHS domain-containing protein
MKYRLIIVLLTLTTTFNACSQKCNLPFPEGKHLINTDEEGKNIAMESYDILTYFEGKPEKGNSKFSSNYEGINYLFVSEAHKDTFDTNPQKFLPQYGGFCAVAASFGKAEELQTFDLYEVVSNKLYFQKNKKAAKVWKKNPKKVIARASNNWNCLVNKYGLDINKVYREPSEIK